MTARQCSVEGCNKSAHSRGWCNQHYKRWATHGDPTKVTVFPVSLSFDGRHPTQAELQSLLEYDPKTGIFLWKERHFASPLTAGWNRRFAGKVAGRKDGAGYVYISIGNRQFLAHRLAIIYAKGTLALGTEIDHRNRDTGDNRLANLRIATTSQNQANQKPKQRIRWPGMSKGVHPHANGRFRANITVHGRNHHLGYFASEAEAHQAYIRAAEMHFADFARAVE